MFFFFFFHLQEKKETKRKWRSKNRKRTEVSELQDIIPTKKICSNGESGSIYSVIFSSQEHYHLQLCCVFGRCVTGRGLVTEKQLMSVARAFGKSWRGIGRQALGIPSVKLEQIEEDNSLHVERVFAMLHYWSKVQREKATAAHLHSLLSQGDEALPPESIDFLLETDWGLRCLGWKPPRGTALTGDQRVSDLLKKHESSLIPQIFLYFGASVIKILYVVNAF